MAMLLRLSILITVLALSACKGPPEGVYPCTEATVATDCPTGWYCHSDHLCWSRIEMPDASTPVDAPGTDAFTPRDAGPDTMVDAGPTCGAETCNGTDDDCDGLVDEGVITVGPAVAVNALDAYGGTLVATPVGFGAIIAAFNDPNVEWSWTPLDRAGVPGTQRTLGSDLAPYSPGASALLAGTNVVFTAVDYTNEVRALVGFDPSSGARTTGPTPFSVPLPTGRHAGAFAALVGSSSQRVTLYVAHNDGAGTNSEISRMRIDLSGSTPTAMGSHEIVTDLGSFAFAALSTPDVDYLLYGRNDGRIALMAGPSGDATGTFHLVGLIGAASAPAFDYGSLAIHDPSAPVSAANPLGVAWNGRQPGGRANATASFVEVTNTTVFASSMPVSFPDALGAWGGFFTYRTIHLVALPDGHEHWILVNQDAESTSPSGGLVQVRELIGPGSSIRRIPVPGEAVGQRSDIGLASSGNTLRILEGGNSGGIVTRSIGCE